MLDVSNWGLLLAIVVQTTGVGVWAGVLMRTVRDLERRIGRMEKKLDA